MEITIRPAIPYDWQAIMNIYNQAVDDGGCTASAEHISVKEREGWLKMHDGINYVIFVAERENSIAGWCSLTPYRPGRKALRKTAEISYYIDRECRGIGIGKKLMAHALEHAPDYGLFNLIAVLLDINAISVRLLEKFGFSRWGHFPDTVDFNGRICGQFIYGMNLWKPIQTKRLEEFPVLETNRLTLRNLEFEDAPVILQLRSDPEMLKYIEMYRLNSLSEAQEMIRINHRKFREGKGIIWGIKLKGEAGIIGYLGYHTIVPEHRRAEVCYLLLPEYWNRGIAKEAVDRITSYAFKELDLNRLESVIMDGNDNSIAVSKHAGYRKEAHFHQHIQYNGKFYDYQVYALLKSDFKRGFGPFSQTG